MTPILPTEVTRIICAFKDRIVELTLDAEVIRPTNGQADVTFEAEGFMITATFQADSKTFSKLVASPIGERWAGQPGVTYTITPPEDEEWR